MEDLLAKILGFVFYVLPVAFVTTQLLPPLLAGLVMFVVFNVVAFVVASRRTDAD